MGMFDIFKKKPDTQTARSLLEQGQSYLWKRLFNEAARALSEASRCPETKAPALAYRSLLKRMQQDVSGALSDADAAIAANPDLFEAHFARIAALLTGKGQDRLVEAIKSWDLASQCVPQNAQAHFLKLLMLLLFAEMTANGLEDAKGVTLNFRHTPVVRGAIRLLDGYAELAGQEFSQVPRSDRWENLALIGRGLALDRQGLKGAARASWNLALSACAGTLSKDMLSLKSLMQEGE